MLKYSSGMNDESKNCCARLRLLHSNLSKQIDSKGTNLRHLDVFLKGWLVFGGGLAGFRSRVGWF